MRLDKFLKLSRLIKQRPRAKSMCDSGAVKVNSNPAKAAYQIRMDDIIEVISGDRCIKAKVLEVPEGNVSRERSQDLISILQESWLDED